VRRDAGEERMRHAVALEQRLDGAGGDRNLHERSQQHGEHEAAPEHELEVARRGGGEVRVNREPATIEHALRRTD